MARRPLIRLKINVFICCVWCLMFSVCCLVFMSFMLFWLLIIVPIYYNIYHCGRHKINVCWFSTIPSSKLKLTEFIIRDSFCCIILHFNIYLIFITRCKLKLLLSLNLNKSILIVCYTKYSYSGSIARIIFFRQFSTTPSCSYTYTYVTVGNRHISGFTPYFRGSGGGTSPSKLYSSILL